MRIVSALTPLIIGVIIAFAAEPATALFQRLFEKRGPRKTRLLGALCAYISLLLVVSLLIYAAFRFYGAGSTLSQKIAKTQNELEETYAQIAIKLNTLGLADVFTSTISKIITLFEKAILEITSDIPKLLAGIASTGADILLGIIIAFYISKDKYNLLPFLKDRVNNVIATLRRSKSRALGRVIDFLSRFLKDIGEIFFQYIRGQLIDAVIMGILFCAALSLIGVPFSIVIGVFGGVANLIPYFGAILSLSAAALSCVLAGKPYKALIAAAAMAVLQQLDALVFIPKIIGKRVDISPLATIVAITTGGSLFGIWGMALAVPIAAIIKKILIPSPPSTL